MEFILNTESNKNIINSTLNLITENSFLEELGNDLGFDIIEHTILVDIIAEVIMSEIEVYLMINQEDIPAEYLGRLPGATLNIFDSIE